MYRLDGQWRWNWQRIAELIRSANTYKPKLFSAVELRRHGNKILICGKRGWDGQHVPYRLLATVGLDGEPTRVAVRETNLGVPHLD